MCVRRVLVCHEGPAAERLQEMEGEKERTEDIERLNQQHLSRWLLSRRQTADENTPSPPISYEASCDPAHGLNKLSRQDKELVVQWCNSTYDSLCPNDFAKYFWQSVASKEALRQPCLKHAMLALSALHLSTVTTSGKAGQVYRKPAQAHRSKAMAAVETSSIRVDPSNHTALFAASSIMLIFEFAFHLTLPSHESDPLNGIHMKLQLIREIIGAFTQVVESDTEGRLQPLLNTTRLIPTMPDMSRLAIMNLQRENCLLHESSHLHETAVYEETIEHLGNSLDTLSHGGEATAVAFRWIAEVPDRFLGLLEEREPFALVIFAHYAVVMHSLRDEWWVNEWGSRILRTICEHLDDRWMQRITWALDATGFSA